MTSAKMFENADISAAYVKYRPVYPPSVANIITSYMRSRGSSGFEVAVDVACGSGQSTFLLCEYFKKVVGLDISQTQIQQANSKCKDAQSTVEFKVADAHSLPIESSSINLLTCAMAWHWLDAEKFYAEAKRVLKPRGCLVVYGHGIHVKDNERVKKAFDAFNNELLHYDFIGEQNMHVLNHYRAVKLPLSQTQRIEFDLPQKSTIDQLLGFMSSVSSYRSYCQQHPENTLLQKIKDSYEMEGDRCGVEEFTLPGFAILGINQ